MEMTMNMEMKMKMTFITITSEEESFIHRDNSLLDFENDPDIIF